jgi:hypothetical protein
LNDNQEAHRQKGKTKQIDQGTSKQIRDRQEMMVERDIRVLEKWQEVRE